MQTRHGLALWARHEPLAALRPRTTRFRMRAVLTGACRPRPRSGRVWPKLTSLYCARSRRAGRSTDHAPRSEQHRAVAEALDRAHVVGDEQDRPPCGAHALELVEALALEGGVADGEHLVDQQHVGVDLDGDREAEPHAHARRVVLELQVDELLELRELDDLVEAPARLPPREPEHDRVDDDVVARGQVGVEAHAELDERRQPAVDRRFAARRCRRCRPGT